MREGVRRGEKLVAEVLQEEKGGEDKDKVERIERGRRL